MSITIENIHTYLTYEETYTEEGDKFLTISWDSENEEIDKIMNTEYRSDLNDGIQNLMWVEKLKKLQIG